MKTFYDVAVVGMHFRGREIKEMVASFIPPLELELEREPHNAYDEWAIKVLYKGEHIGYIERNEAAWIAPFMDEGREFICTCERLEERKKNIHPICTISEVESA